MTITPLIIIVIALAVCFDFLNGVHDSSNIVATIISSRALTPRAALTITAIAEFTGPLVFGVAVANTIGHEVVAADTINIQVVIAALISAICWNLLTWYLGFPSSSSHALVGGFVGSVIVGAGWQKILLPGLEKILLALFVSPIIGFVVGYFIRKLIILMCWSSSPRVSSLFKRGQIVTGIALALSHGANDAQKTMGVITLALVIGGYLPQFTVPLWVVIMSGAAIAIGTSVGGWRLIRTLGAKFFKIRPVDGFSAQLASASVILSASLFGGPVSTTQVVSAAIMGVGAGERANKVRWGVGKEIGIAWVMTIPATALLAGGLYFLITKII
jgi:PiT family inorganic phosphate transporter